MASLDNDDVSSIIKFFAARDNTIASGVVGSGPGEDFESATYGNFDVWSTLEEWESLLTDRELEQPTAAGGPDVVAGSDSPLVLLVSRDLTEALADADAEALGGLAERWSVLRAEEGEAIDDELARELIGEVAALAADAVRSRNSLYCWVC
ncbi:hypothetical protein ONA91_38235 [Micromonospora sp. DR5-3]|nr:hypothetical protein [Micromonospora sp. DR5-3]MCW3820285.1 hypothetical protein [Micromonospora sp. DR5-3]